MNLDNKKKSAGKTTAAPATKCNQLTAALRQFEHLIFQSGKTWPHSEHDQMIFGILATFGRHRPGALAVKLSLRRTLQTA